MLEGYRGDAWARRKAGRCGRFGDQPRSAAALKPGGSLALTFHHNKLEAYYAVGMAILDAGLVCTASFPCPAEMGGSIHIHGTASSIIDTVFVCRASEPAEVGWLTESPEQLAAIVSSVSIAAVSLERSTNSVRVTPRMAAARSMSAKRSSFIRKFT